MKFYGRTDDLRELHRIGELSQQRGRMTVISGRRRIGKTRLILESLREQEYLYFFVARRDERLLCEEYTEQIQRVLKVRIIVPFVQFRQVFEYLLSLAAERHLNVVIDEFQEFLRINPSVYSDMQNLWDQHKETIRMNLILSGSVQSLMVRIFDDYQQPLFGRANAKFFIRPLSLSTLRQIMDAQEVPYTALDFLTLYTITGGIPQYVEEFVDRGATTYSRMLDEILHQQSMFLDEGRFLLMQEFGKDYTTYFSVLALIAVGKTSRGEIESVLQRPTGGYLTKLQDEYRIIKRLRPLFSKPGTTNIRYYIDDNFLRFWFRFIYRNDAAIESRNYAYVRQLIDRDFTTYAGHLLEKLIRQQLIETQQFSAVGQYWQRNGQNEIDVIAINELDRTAIVGEVKLQAKYVDLSKLKLKATAIAKPLQGYAVTYRSYSLEDLVGE